jgi:prepilin-type N-terminal cleavage/methylation domain-containing protein
MRRSAFTVIELLVVVSIIAILSAMLLTTINYVRENAKVNKTKAILHGALVGVSTTSMRTNVNVSPVEHPLASTMATASLSRPAFYRGEAVTSCFAVGDAVATTGQAYMVADPKTVDGTVIANLLMPSDRYGGGTGPTDTDSPMLFGYDRRYLKVLGTGYGLHSVRRLPAVSPINDRNGDGVLDNPPYVENPASGVAYPNTLDQATGNLASTTSFEIEQKKLMDYIFGPEVLSELSALDGIRAADDATGAAVNSSLISNQRLRSWGPSEARWDASRIRIVNCSVVRDVDGIWKPYRLRGPALYDAWGHEIIAFLASNGALVLESAGRDGVLRWNPGGDGVFQTGASDSTPSGDDRDGSKDNLDTGLK